MKQESTKYSLLDFLKKKPPPGPFSTEAEVREYMSSEVEDEMKNKRLYNEVRYAKITCMSLKPTAEVFRLKRNA